LFLNKSDAKGSSHMISDLFPGKAIQKTCPGCGTEFTCGPAVEEKNCWCDELPHISPVAAEDHGCLCRTCLKELIARIELSQRDVAQTLSTKGNEMSQPSLIEGEDYYCEESAIVFTARYHLRRGYCCESGCRHCPYKLE